MAQRPQAIAFDVLDTLFATAPLAEALARAGLPAQSLELWLARTLRNGFALAASGAFRPFDEVARATLAGAFADHGLSDGAGKLDQVLAALRELPPHPDVGPALSRVRAAGVPAIALTNGTANATRELLGNAGLAPLVEGIVSIDDVQQWKPRPEVYWHVARLLGVPAPRVAAVAAHAWDVHGAHRAGLTTGWVRRAESRIDAFDAPDVVGEDLVEVCERLLALPQ
ncbi:MAG TPA: haloacid dehalogenase type II [Thermoanaerobaculia bacterium]|jgi:2-haloacid dehalogenase|nr:haloacid dehalogenase type II [Thermoanaerobaculia bacterium]